MFYEWDSLLETGDQKIDAQHKQLIEALNALLDSCLAGEGPLGLERTIDFLLGYTVKHFADEEALQEEYAYPDYLRHRQLHEEFKLVAVEMADTLRRDGFSAGLVTEVHSRIGDWLVNHIKGDDLRMALFVKSKQDCS